MKKISLAAAVTLLSSSQTCSTEAFSPSIQKSLFGVSTTRLHQTATTTIVPTEPIAGMKPGTSGLRKKVEVWQGLEGDKHYVENFIQSLLDTAAAKNHGKMPETCVYVLLLRERESWRGFICIGGLDLFLLDCLCPHHWSLSPLSFCCTPYNSIIVAGDGRYYNDEAIAIICRVLAGNGVANIWVPSSGIMSTPAVSAAIRERLAGQADGGIILTASHNPGGPGEDFGIKYNLEYGQPAGEDFTDEVSLFLCFLLGFDMICSVTLGVEYSYSTVAHSFTRPTLSHTAVRTKLEDRVFQNPR